MKRIEPLLLPICFFSFSCLRQRPKKSSNLLLTSLMPEGSMSTTYLYYQQRWEESGVLTFRNLGINEENRTITFFSLKIPSIPDEMAECFQQDIKDTKICYCRSYPCTTAATVREAGSQQTYTCDLSWKRGMDPGFLLEILWLYKKSKRSRSSQI